MNQKKSITFKNRNKYTTNKQVVDMALTLWECSEYLTKTVLRTNLSSYFRDRNSRLVQKMNREAIALGKDLDPPNLEAFINLNNTKQIARQLGL
jgi:hypothetical protein